MNEVLIRELERVGKESREGIWSATHAEIIQKSVDAMRAAMKKKPPTPQKPLKLFDVCRAKNGAPAIYAGYGYCVFISAQDNSYGFNPAEHPAGGEEKLPLPERDVVSLVFGVLGRAKRGELKFEEETD